jgi:hypothetical protein
LFTLHTVENSALRQAGFAADRAESDDEVVWDDAEEDEVAGSNTAIESSSATHGDEGSEELEDSGKPLSHSSKFPGPSSLRDWSEDDDDETWSVATPGGAALHVAAAATTGAQAPQSWICQNLRSNLLLLQSQPLRSRQTRRGPEAGRLTPREGTSRL